MNLLYKLALKEFTNDQQVSILKLSKRYSDVGLGDVISMAWIAKSTSSSLEFENFIGKEILKSHDSSVSLTFEQGKELEIVDNASNPLEILIRAQDSLENDHKNELNEALVEKLTIGNINHTLFENGGITGSKLAGLLNITSRHGRRIIKKARSSLNHDLFDLTLDEFEVIQ